MTEEHPTDDDLLFPTDDQSKRLKLQRLKYGNMENKQNSNRIFETAEPIPEGSHFDKYTKTMITINQLLHQDFETNFPQFEMFLKGIFRDCVRFLTPVSPRLQIRLRLIYNNEEYLALEKQVDENNFIIKQEMAKVPTTAFVLDNGVFAIIHVNVARCLLGNNSPSLVFNYVASLIHELSHIKNFGKSEKEIQELETSILEEFLGWKLPEEYKNRETSDYYFQSLIGGLFRLVVKLSNFTLESYHEPSFALKIPPEHSAD